MGDRHFFSDHSTIVLRSMTGLANTQPNLSVIPSNKTVINADHDDTKVTLICGGGSVTNLDQRVHRSQPALRERVWSCVHQP